MLICNSCRHENPIYYLNCEKCNSILRDKTVNIDLWSIISKLIDSPGEAFRKIIQSENKNFIFLHTVLIALKVFLACAVVLPYFSVPVTINFLTIFIFFGYTLAVLTFISLLIGAFARIKDLKTRFKDNFSILTYALMPVIFGMVILFPLEIAVFGETLFFPEPSPFMVKNTFAYIFLSLEILLFLWGMILTVAAIKQQIKNIFSSIVLGAFMIFLMFILPLLLLHSVH